MADDVTLCCRVLVLLLISSQIDAQSCKIAKHLVGTYFSIEAGKDVKTKLKTNGMEVGTERGTCHKYWSGRLAKNSAVDNKEDAKILFKMDSNCYKCYIVYYRTVNILQYKLSSCVSQQSGRPEPTLDSVCGQIPAQTILYTFFRTNLNKTNCKDTFEGVFQFSYEFKVGGGGICNATGSVIEACQEPGSPYVNNEVFRMTYAACPGLSQSKDDLIRFQCMGMWRDDDDNIMSAVANLQETRERFRFKCVLTRKDQQRTDNKQRYAMTDIADCTTAKNPYDGPIRLILIPVLGQRQRNDLTPSCNLPTNYSGVWFTSGEYDSTVFINSTHIHFQTKLDQFNIRDTYFTCQQTRDSRYMMTAVTVGKCDVDYICMDFLPRHQNIIRYRMGKPYRLTFEEMQDPKYLVNKFRQSCSWHAYTFNRDQIEWKYNYFVLYEPSPVPCPIAGKYKFVQEGAVQEYYTTRIKAVTDFPWHRIPCEIHEQDFAICSADATKIFIDADRCQTVDQNARPVNIYDAPDRTLSCVGYWMEDYRSYLITFDIEDAVSRFRCWVYERLNWKDLVISRATRANCGVKQTAWSKDSAEGASLLLKLYENERVHDQCPRVFMSGHKETDVNPYQLKYLGGSESGTIRLLASLWTILLLLANMV